jgi:cytochrome d ubiquinol oxidase subunit II
VQPDALPDPLAKTVSRAAGAWLGNYQRWPLTMLLPATGYLGCIAAMLLLRGGRSFAAFWASALGLSGVIATAGISMFPFIMPSSSHPASSLTVWDSVSSQLTLG